MTRRTWSAAAGSWPRPSGRKGKPILDSPSPRCRPPTCILSAKCFSIWGLNRDSSAGLD